MSRFVVRGNLLLGQHLRYGTLRIEGDTIAGLWVDDPSPPAAWGDTPIYDAAFISPGFVDLQVNGGFGVEVGDDPEAIRVLARRLPETGVTAFLPTIVTAPTEFYPKAIAAFEAAKDAPGARPIGLHMEGPFLSPNRHGAHRRDLIENADSRLIDRFLASEAVRLVTLAPERPGGLEMIRALEARGIVVSLGHTDATYEEFIAGIDAGAWMATHLYNAMSPFTHRAPGAVAAALLDDRVFVGLIADGVHSHPASVQLAARLKPGGIALVTDAMAAAGMPPGVYTLAGQEVIVDETAARLNDGTLAGSLLTMDQAIRNFVQWTTAQDFGPGSKQGNEIRTRRIADALYAASILPTRLVRSMSNSFIAGGSNVDLVLLDEHLQVQTTIIGGEIVYQREGV
jgi:N-acetylglucosamine-6-phosphate deacetylase